LTDYEFADALNLAEGLLDECKKIAAVWVNIDKAVSRTDINRRAVKTLVRMIISIFHDAMILNITPTKQIANFDQKEQIEKIAARFDPEHAAEKISDCYRVMQWIESSVNDRLIFERLLLSLADSDTIKNR
jgi:hypothetical protein